MTVRGGKLYAVLADVCAFANTNGGTLYIGIADDAKKPPVGVTDIEQGIHVLEKEINNRISPPLHISIDVHDYKGKKIIRILVPRGDEPPYAVDDNKIYVRDEAETGLAVRDEIVSLVLRNKNATMPATTPAAEPYSTQKTAASIETPNQENPIEPRTGVEVLPPEERQGKQYFTMRDLRNGNVVKNVTRVSARKLWHYAIDRYTTTMKNFDPQQVKWRGDLGMLRKHKQGNITRYDLILRAGQNYRFFFGVTDDGIHGEWRTVTGLDDGER